MTEPGGKVKDGNVNIFYFAVCGRPATPDAPAREVVNGEGLREQNIAIHDTVPQVRATDYVAYIPSDGLSMIGHLLPMILWILEHG